MYSVLLQTTKRGDARDEEYFEIVVMEGVASIREVL